MSKKPFPCKDVINEWMEDTTQTLQIRVANSNSTWSNCRSQVPVLSDQFEYRIADNPEPLNIKFPEFIRPEYEYLAMNADGKWFAFVNKPSLYHDAWTVSSGGVLDINAIILMPRIPSARWKETLIKRP